jgi:hypothetical protein
LSSCWPRFGAGGPNLNLKKKKKQSDKVDVLENFELQKSNYYEPVG